MSAPITTISRAAHRLYASPTSLLTPPSDVVSTMARGIEPINMAVWNKASAVNPRVIAGPPFLGFDRFS
jgi:hypothetical protein